MTKEAEQYRGLVLDRLVTFAHDAVSIKRLDDVAGGYIINGNIGLVIKYSSRRMSPWQFVFSQRNKQELDHLRRGVEKVYIALVCKNGGVAALGESELQQLIGSKEHSEWVGVFTGKRKMYSVSGTGGKLKYKIPRNRFPACIFGVEVAEEVSTEDELEAV